MVNKASTSIEKKKKVGLPKVKNHGKYFVKHFFFFLTKSNSKVHDELKRKKKTF